MIEAQLRDAIGQREGLEARLNKANSEIERLQGFITEISRERDELRLKVQDLQRELEKVKINFEFQIRQTIVRNLLGLVIKRLGKGNYRNQFKVCPGKRGIRSLYSEA